MKKATRFLLFLHAFVGIGAMAGGLMAILNPGGPAGMPTAALENSPFSDYLIPGIILFAFIGIGNVLCALLFRFHLKYQGYISCIFSGGLAIWIIVQCIMLKTVVILHVIYLIIGLVGAFLSVIVGYAQHLFPSDTIHNIMRNINRKAPKNIILKKIGKIEESIYNTNAEI